MLGWVSSKLADVNVADGTVATHNSSSLHHDMAVEKE